MWLLSGPLGSSRACRSSLSERSISRHANDLRYMVAQFAVDVGLRPTAIRDVVWVRTDNSEHRVHRLATFDQAPKRRDDRILVPLLDLRSNPLRSDTRSALASATFANRLSSAAARGRSEDSAGLRNASRLQTSGSTAFRSIAVKTVTISARRPLYGSRFAHFSSKSQTSWKPIRPQNSLKLKSGISS